MEGRTVHLAVNVFGTADAEGRFQGVLIVMEDLTPLIGRSERPPVGRSPEACARDQDPLTPHPAFRAKNPKKFNEGDPSFNASSRGVTTSSRKSRPSIPRDAFSASLACRRFPPSPADAELWSLIRPCRYSASTREFASGGICRARFERTTGPRKVKRALINLIDNATRR